MAGEIAGSSQALRGARAVAVRLGLALTACLALLTPTATGAAVITVDSPADAGSNNGSCTLTEAITNANDDAQTEADCDAGSGADRIVLLVSPLLTSDKDATSEQTGLPRITSRIDIDGRGNQISATTNVRLFHVTSTGVLTLRNVTLRDGLQSLAAAKRGGAIYNAGGKVTIVGSWLTNNRVALAEQGTGGAIHSENGELTLIDSAVTDNQVETPWARGGGIYSSNDRLTLINTQVSFNTLSSTRLHSSGFDNIGSGAGIAAEGTSGTILLNRVTVSNNNILISAAASQAVLNPYALGGGMLLAGDGSTRLVNVTISSNVISTQGANGRAEGAGLYANADVTIEHGTIASNQAYHIAGTHAQGAGIYAGPAKTVTLSASLLANNHNDQALTSLDSCHVTTIVDGGANRADDATCGTIASDLTSSDLDFALADHGGPGGSHALLEDSLAIDLVSDCELEIDGRNALRSSPSCDSGAFEYAADDRYELSGQPPVTLPDPDDECFGHHVPFGRAERHLHTSDEDWVWFSAAAGSTYEIETLNLLADADTILELFEGCVSLGISDDDGGAETYASKITYAVPGASTLLDVKIREFGNAYANGRGYDVVLRCTAGCTGCQSPGGSSYFLGGERVVSHREIEACSSIVGTSSVVAPQAELRLRSGGSVVLDEGFGVEASGTLTIELDPNLAVP